MKEATRTKFENISNRLAQKEVLVAFSGGVDSTVLASIAKDSASRVVLLTITSPTVPQSELEDAMTVAAELGLEHIVRPFEWLETRDLAGNPENRCYTCKQELAQLWLREADALGLKTVIEGTTATETEGYRPGLAALQETRVESPYLVESITKDEIREVAFERGLSIADKPSGACLATRFPYGTEITTERLAMVERVESAVRELFGVECVRARFHGDLVRVEVGQDEMEHMFDVESLQRLNQIAKEAGFTYATLDTRGYRTSAMDESLTT
ncbi:MAG: ATP-dependent sacrificial sulfur transferase LarE [Candidatus Thorarchaeota archaeon]|jgi:uncharacterized protein